MEYLTTNQIEKEFEKLMLERKRYLINEDLEKAREDYNFPKLKYATFKPDTVGIMTRIENEISASRRIYNNSVTYYNNLINAFPRLIIASILGYTEEEWFNVGD